MNKANLKLFVHGSAVSMFGVGTLGIMNYFIRRTLLLNLSKEDFGFLYGAFALIMLLLVFLDLGLAQSATILLSKSFAEQDRKKSRNIFTLTFVSRLLLALLVFSLMAILSPYLNHYYFKYTGSFTLLILIFLLIPFQTLESALTCVFAARKAFKTQNILMNIKALIILVGIFFTVREYGIQSSILWFVSGSLALSIVACFIVRKYGISLVLPANIDFSGLNKIFALSSWIAVSTAGIAVMYQLDTVCLTWLSGLKSVAMYNIALPIMQIVQSFFVFPVIFTPFVAEMWQKNDYAGIQRTCYRGSLLMLLTLPVFIFGGLYFASDIICILFGSEYIAVAPAVTILWIGMVFFSIATFNINALSSGGSQKISACLVIACVIVNFLLNVILIRHFDYVGAALATAITYFIMAAGAMISLAFVFRRKNIVRN